LSEGARKAKILIVEDEPSILETMRFALEQAGYECLLARDGPEAITVARTQSPALILLDIMLPKLNGYQVCRLLKQDRRFSSIPVIMVTARTQDRDYVQGKECGADDYLTKPFVFPDLLQVVERHLSAPPSA
jgi:DNA-binding response OmpR family regulator